MANFNFELDGLDELESDLRFAMEEYPKEMRSGLRKLQTILRKAAKQEHRTETQARTRRKAT